MDALSRIISGALNQVDQDWQHGLSPRDLDAYVQEMANAIENALVMSTGGPDHVVRVDGSRWTIQHPLAERFEPEGSGRSLMDCRYNLLVDVAMAQGAMFDGTHRVWIEDGVLLWEESAE